MERHMTTRSSCPYGKQPDVVVRLAGHLGDRFGVLVVVVERGARRKNVDINAQRVPPKLLLRLPDTQRACPSIPDQHCRSGQGRAGHGLACGHDAGLARGLDTKNGKPVPG